MKGIILAGGSGTRLHPITFGVSKQLLPIYDKPMIYYPLSVLMLAGIREILIISTPHDLKNYKKLLKNGSDFGIKLSYVEQPSPDGLAQAFILGESFIKDDPVCLVLGDNIFYGAGLNKRLTSAVNMVNENSKAVIFANYVNDPKRFGIVEIDDSSNQILSIEEKPENPKSNFAVVGLYFYPNNVIKMTKKLKPSNRGELEITSLNELYLKSNKLELQILSRGYAWLDTGTHDALANASEFVRSIEKRTGLKIACLEEIALGFNWVNKDDIYERTVNMKGVYYDYVKQIIKN